MAAWSLGSSTTQITAGSRLPSRQTRHRSPSDTLKHSRQNRTFSLAPRSASARRRASSGGAFTTWNARRWADLGPIPGRRDSSSIRSWMGPSYTSGPVLDLRAQLGPQPGHGIVAGRRRLVVDLDHRALHRGIPGHAVDGRLDAEHLGEDLPELVLLRPDLLH